MKQTPPVVWCVDGSDSSAHAGLQVDLRTGEDLSCPVETIVTCITAQSLKGVRLVEPVSIVMFNEQWQRLLDESLSDLLEDRIPAAIKVGLLPSIELIEACSDWLKKIKVCFPNVLVVFDPVVAISNKPGNRLQQTLIGDALLKHMLPYVDVITPNVMMFETLTGLSCEQQMESLHEQLPSIFKHTRCRWLLQGGYSNENQTTDWWFDQQTLVGFSSEKLIADNNYERGCTLSTALASFIAHGYDLLDATTMAEAYVIGAFKSGVQVDEGTALLGNPGWPLQIDNLPRIIPRTSNFESEIEAVEPTLCLPFAKMNIEKMGLYPVVDSVEWLELVLEQGVQIAQLRIKNPEDKELESKIQSAIVLGEKYQAQVFINDYWKQAIELGAYGVHLGQEDLDVADLARIQQAGLRLGISTHGYYEIARAQSIQPSYIALGHIFPTQTKDMPSQPQGLKRLSHYSELLKNHFPTVAIGGIDAGRLPMVARTGVDSVALVSAITKAKEPEKATRMLMAALTQVKKELD
jgi:hydroxymethylpyrimidine kinase/phosphomethylpyrimidine kinase/thiamine-phosphate diphosphorylase